MSSPVRFRLGIAYDGTHFNGWAKQPGLRTVQGVLEEAVATLFRKSPVHPSFSVAGRTDSGVHATGQVAHVDLERAHVAALESTRLAQSTGRKADELLRDRLNGILGSYTDVIITSCDHAPEGFDARFSASWRRYEFRIADALAVKDPLQRHRTVWYGPELDVELMALACQGMLGLGDFAAYCKARDGATTIRTLQEFSWRRDADGVVIATLQADAFCHSMVRSLMGAAVAVSEGRLTSDRLAALLHERRRSGEVAVLPARGLTLLEVAYPADSDVAARADQTRARREAAELAEDASNR
ncbi:tRNA pseudouridine synthase A [Amnibacterium flavum]|uniref:tRNA pseudouridine synthase A n=1 Tax=Amnibacterium flavum TaxID=2173173 RepID=A0A2V1HR75_9MICO|nr:tRNA pseudouridine synthase A [Amnibacterium flavum]PVZ95065.1 tRNA pseudouridine(38-40) synthase TruA [Amnibacterium flavum]